MEGQHQGMDRRVDDDVIAIAHDKSRWAAITAEAFVRVPQRRLDVTGIS